MDSAGEISISFAGGQAVGFANRAADSIAAASESGVVTGLQFSTEDVKDISPLRALTRLRTLQCGVREGSNRKSPLADLSPLKDMKLTRLDINVTSVSDLSQLKGMPLTHLYFENTPVSDSSPLKGMPLTFLRCDFNPERDAAILRSIKTLVNINDKPVKEFWKEADAKKVP